MTATDTLEALAMEIGSTVVDGINDDCLEYVLRRGYVAMGIAPNTAGRMIRKLAECQLEDLEEARATTHATLARALDRIEGLEAALRLCLAELDWQTEQAKHCGDPNYECPMQDIHNPDDGHLLARNAARAALTHGGDRV